MSKKKLLFIIPPYFDIEDFLTKKEISSLPVFTIPYGILSMEAYINHKVKKNVNIELLDLNILAYMIVKDKPKKNIKEIHTNLMTLISDKLDNSVKIVGISTLFNNAYNYLKDITTTIKSVENPPLCVVGGGLASNLYKTILNDFPLIDAICYAEGEVPMADLLNANNYKILLNEHPAWITKQNLKNGKIPKAYYIENLDEIPMFDYGLIDLKNYNGRAMDKRFCNDKIKRELSIHTSRGCPFKCVYCANIALHGRKVRFMSVQRVISEVDNMIEKFGMNVLLIEDDHFLADKKRAAEILKELSSRNIRIEFPNGIAVYAIDEEIGFLLKKAGVTTIQLAVESGSEYVLKKLINKPLKTSKIPEVVNILRKNNIIIHAFIVLGIPGEMDEHRQETLEMIKKVGFDWVYFFIAIPVAGSRLYDICITNDYLVNKDFSHHITSKGAIKAPGVDPEKIEKASYLMNLEVNFINNFNVLSGFFDKALPYFFNISEKYPGHAFAHYILSNIFREKKEFELSNKHYNIYTKLINENNIWKSYAEYFKLEFK